MSEVYVNSAQLRKAADLLASADPCVCNGDVQERPGYLSQAEDDSQVAVLSIGILPSTEYRINRRGKCEER